jgi:hypothetical protein
MCIHLAIGGLVRDSDAPVSRQARGSLRSAAVVIGRIAVTAREMAADGAIATVVDLGPRGWSNEQCQLDVAG